MDFGLDYYSISLLIGGFIALISGFAVYLHSVRSVENTSWFIFNISSAVWSFGYFATITAPTKEFAFIADWVLHQAAIIVPLSYLVSVIFLTGSYGQRKIEIAIISVISAFFLIITPTELFVRDVVPKANFNFVPDAGPLYIYFTIYFFFLVLYILYILIEKLQLITDKLDRVRYKYMILFTTVGSIGGGSVFFLTFNIPILPYPIILFSLFPIISIYAIFRYKLFNVKVITTELIVFILWIFLLLRVFLSVSSVDRFVNIGLLVFMVIVGIFLIKSVLKEVSLREKLQKTTADLEHANERLKEVDQLKSEFLSLATHQIRAPLTAIKGYASLILEGDYGEVSEPVFKAVDVISKSCQNLVMIVNDFLNISRIEQGRMKYDLSEFDLRAITEQVLTELKPNIENAGLTCTCVGSAEQHMPVMVYADSGKVRQVIGNLVDNAIKYTPQGGITVDVSHHDAMARLTITDTGIGIAKEDIGKLFNKFTRAKDANKTNVIGTGLGLYVAKQMVEAQGGKIWIESDGVGKGTTFIVELPQKM